MTEKQSSRRTFMKGMGAGAASLSVHVSGKEADPELLSVDPGPRFDLSPGLYMQFMEPLGTTDGSVAAAWDFGRHRWRRAQHLLGEPEPLLRNGPRVDPELCPYIPEVVDEVP